MNTAIVASIYLGENLGNGRHFEGRCYVEDGSGRPIVRIDQKCRKYAGSTVAAGVADGDYIVTRTAGQAPGDVDYWGYKAAA